jgi:hypothetical protein
LRIKATRIETSIVWLNYTLIRHARL